MLLRNRLMFNVSLLREQINERGMEIYGDPSAIVAVKTGDEGLARLVSRELPGLGLLANLVEFPAVGKGQARFRLQVMAGHTSHDIVTAADRLAEGVARATRCLDAGTGPAALAG